MHAREKSDLFLDLFADIGELEDLVDSIGIGVRNVNAARDAAIETRQGYEGFDEVDYREAAELLKKELASHYVAGRLAIIRKCPRSR